MNYKDIAMINQNMNNFKYKKNFCNNCGQKGHIYRECTKPISSFGIICYRDVVDEENNTKKEILLIRRKDSLGYVEFIRGRYDITNKNHIMNLFDEMTINEKEKLLKNDFEVLWDELWCFKNTKKFDQEKNESLLKLKKLKEGTEINGENYTLERFVNESTTNWEEPEWGFPKGRRNKDEFDMHAAAREFSEETGINAMNITILFNLQPYQEYFVGSNFKSYKHTYYIACLNNKKNKNNSTEYQKEEVSKIGWFSIEECKEKIRNYNYKRIDILDHIKHIFNEYILCEL